jgi:L-rhamnose 1-dehydrogenase
VKAAIDTFGRIDHLISNAGICPFHPLLTLPADLWRGVQDVNLNGAFFLVQAVANQMATQELIDGERGNIIAISSISALMGGGEQCHYTPTKAGLKSLMESCAIALGPLGIRCNSVLPGEYGLYTLGNSAPHSLGMVAARTETEADGMIP